MTQENTISDVTLRKRTFRAIDLREVVSKLALDRATGSLVINFSQGAPGTIEWTEKVRSENKS